MRVFEKKIGWLYRLMHVESWYGKITIEYTAFTRTLGVAQFGQKRVAWERFPLSYKNQLTLDKRVPE